MMRRQLQPVVGTLAFLLLAVLTGPARAEVAPGDLIFHTSLSSQSKAIQEATGSRYSHMGVIFLQSGKRFVLEAVGPVRATPLEDWQARGQGGHYVVKRLRQPLTPEALEKLHREGARFLGRPYDLTFEWSDDRLYCSELVWKIYKRALGIRIGELQKLRDFNLTSAQVRQKLKERYGDRIPMDEPVISPGRMFASPLLVTVEERWE